MRFAGGGRAGEGARGGEGSTSSSLLVSAVPFPTAQPVGALPRCIPGPAEGATCRTVVFAPETERTVALMQRVAADSGLVRRLGMEGLLLLL